MKIKQIIKKLLNFILSESLYARLRYTYNLHRQYFKNRKDIILTNTYAEKLNTMPKKEKIVLVFIMYMPETWPSLEPIYDYAMLRNDFSVYILAQPYVDNQQGLLGKNTAYDFLSKLYPNVINAYQNEHWFDLKSLKPDYVFYTRPYNIQYYDDYKNGIVKEYAKVCLHQYGYIFTSYKKDTVCLNIDFLKNTAIDFAVSPSTNEIVRKKLKIGRKRNYPKAEYFGFARFDLVTKNKNQKKRKTILWTSRWATQAQSNNYRTHFLTYIDDILCFAENHIDVDFIIRPHPLMFANFIATGVMSRNDIDMLVKKCNAFQNITLDESKNYLDSLRGADIYVTDFSGLIAEFFVTGKPIIYCEKQDELNGEGKLIDPHMYHAQNWSEIEAYLLKLLSGEDVLLEQRKMAINLLLPPNSCKVGERILDYIKRDYYGV